MEPFGRVAFPTMGIMGLVGVEAIRGLRPVAVGTKWVRPVIGAIGESPGVAMERGVNMARFGPGIMDMLGREPIPRGHTVRGHNSQNASVETISQTYFRLACQ